MPTFVYVMDPMCSWCWAFTPSIEALKSHFPNSTWQYILGGLAPDSDDPMPEAMQAKIASIWKQIERNTGTRFNHGFWANNSPRRSTYPACRAVIAAEMMRSGAGEEMAKAIQEAYYLNAQNPSDQTTLVSLCAPLSLDPTTFIRLLTSSEVQQELENNLHNTQRLGAQGFPSLFILHNEQIHVVSYGFIDAEEALHRAEQILAG